MVEKATENETREIVKNEINNYRNLFVNELDYCQEFDICIENTLYSQTGIIWTMIKVNKNSRKIISNKWTGDGFKNTLAMASLLSTALHGVHIQEGSRWKLEDMENALSINIPDDLILNALVPLNSFNNACRLYSRGVRN